MHHRLTFNKYIYASIWLTSFRSGIFRKFKPFLLLANRIEYFFMFLFFATTLYIWFENATAAYSFRDSLLRCSSDPLSRNLPNKITGARSCWYNNDDWLADMPLLARDPSSFFLLQLFLCFNGTQLAGGSNHWLADSSFSLAFLKCNKFPYIRLEIDKTEKPQD